MRVFREVLDAESRIPVIGKAGRIPESTPPILDVLDAELAADTEAELASSVVMRAARAIVARLDLAMSYTKSETPLGNLSGSVRSRARHAKATGRQIVVGIFGRWFEGVGLKVCVYYEANGLKVCVYYEANESWRPQVRVAGRSWRWSGGK